MLMCALLAVYANTITLPMMYQVLHLIRSSNNDQPVVIILAVGEGAFYTNFSIMAEGFIVLP